MAYLTDHQEVTNTFTVGEVEVELTEPDYPGNTSDEVKNLVPNQEVSKNPQIANTGANEAIVFMTVEVPVGNVTVVKDDGTKEEKGITDLFWFKMATDNIGGTIANNFNTNTWMELPALRDISEVEGTDSRYVFAYKDLVGESGNAEGTDKTEPLFGKVQLKNIIEDEVANDRNLNVNVKAYAIQASNILEDNGDLTTDLNEENLAKIYNIYCNQNDITTP